MKTSDPPQRKGAASRAIAVQVLTRVEADGAFAAAALDAALSRNTLQARDRAFVTELVYGTLRVRGALRERLEAQATRGLPKDPFVRITLLVAAYQVLVLERVPHFAAVEIAVEAIRKKRGRALAGFANALLRRVAESKEPFDVGDAAFRSLPEWLRDRLIQDVGEGAARSLVLPLSTDEEGGAGTWVRLVKGATVPEWLASAPPGRLSAQARFVPRGGDLRKKPGFAEGAFVVQEEGSQGVALALGARPGETVLDACAGRGQKTGILAENVGDAGVVWAVELHKKRLEALTREMGRLGLGGRVQARALDWTAEHSDLGVPMDRILVDAPCTGVGTLRHRPEIALRLSPEDPERMGALSAQILRAAVATAGPDARVVYAVCSVLRAECEDVLERVADVLSPVPFDAEEPADVLRGQTSVRLLPETHATDGYFLASLRPKKPPAS